jgi:hypothetical protein
LADDKHHKIPPPAHPRERRKVPRRPSAADDWESIALGRVARRVGALPDTPASAEPGTVTPEPDRSFGWEEAALRNLRQRLKDRGST